MSSQTNRGDEVALPSKVVSLSQLPTITGTPLSAGGGN